MSSPTLPLVSAGLLLAVPTWSQEDFTLRAPSPIVEAEFGRVLDVHDTTAVVGAPFDDAGR